MFIKSQPSGTTPFTGECYEWDLLGNLRNSTARILSPRAHSEAVAVIPTSNDRAKIGIRIQFCYYLENAER